MPTPHPQPFSQGEKGEKLPSPLEKGEKFPSPLEKGEKFPSPLEKGEKFPSPFGRGVRGEGLEESRKTDDQFPIFHFRFLHL